LVFQLAVTNGGTGETNAFPMYEEPRRYRLNESRLLRDVRPAHRQRIEAMQPYHIVYDLSPRAIQPTSRYQAWIQVIVRLDNLDKHRLLLASSAVSPARQPTFTGVKRAKGRWAGEGTWIPLVVGAELFTVDELEPMDDAPEIRVEPPPVYTLRFGDADFTAREFWDDRTKGAATMLDLEEATKAVEQVVASFTYAFEAANA
jgi:hypothetical protein